MPNWGIHAQSACSNQVSKARAGLPSHSDNARTKSISTAISAIQRAARRPAAAPRQDAGDERNENEPEQDHKNITIATNMTAPQAIPAAYQRSLPVSV